MKATIETLLSYLLVATGIVLLFLLWTIGVVPNETHEHNYYE